MLAAKLFAASNTRIAVNSASRVLAAALGVGVELVDALAVGVALGVALGVADGVLAGAGIGAGAEPPLAAALAETLEVVKATQVTPTTQTMTKFGIIFFTLETYLQSKSPAT